MNIQFPEGFDVSEIEGEGLEVTFAASFSPECLYKEKLSSEEIAQLNLTDDHNKVCDQLSRLIAIRNLKAAIESCNELTGDWTGILSELSEHPLVEDHIRSVVSID